MAAYRLPCPEEMKVSVIKPNVCVHVYTHGTLEFTFFGSVANEELHVFYHIPELQMCDWENIHTASSTCDMTAVQFQQWCYTVQKAKL